MEAKTTTDGRGRTPGFKGVRNVDTTAARAVRQRNALERHLLAARTLLEQHGHLVVTPAERDWLMDGGTDEDAWRWVVTSISDYRRERNVR